MKFEEIWKPRIIINVSHLREHAITWYATNNRDGGLQKKSKELKDACGYRWGNTAEMIQAGHGLYMFQLYEVTHRVRGHLGWSVHVYHDVWGCVFSSAFKSDDDGKIPNEVIDAIRERCDRVNRGYIRCAECESEVAYTDSHGMYLDIRYCSAEHAERNKTRDNDRGK